MTGKRRLNFATLITKERLNFPAANLYPVDSMTHGFLGLENSVLNRGT
jgi:hypothetical protein